MTVALESTLAKAGLRVTASQFLAFVEDAARMLAPPHADPAAHFSGDQRAALADVGLDLGPARDGEIDPRARAVAAQAVLRDSALTARDAAATIGVDASRIRHKVGERALVGWKERGSWRLPAWQFTDNGLLPGLEVVLHALPADQPPLVVAAFMTTPQGGLTVNGAVATPREWLLAGGDPRRVADVAAMLGTPV